MDLVVFGSIIQHLSDLKETRNFNVDISYAVLLLIKADIILRSEVELQCNDRCLSPLEY
jgi:hypothetical protein